MEQPLFAILCQGITTESKNRYCAPNLVPLRSREVLAVLHTIWYCTKLGSCQRISDMQLPGRILLLNRI